MQASKEAKLSRVLLYYTMIELLDAKLHPQPSVISYGGGGAKYTDAKAVAAVEAEDPLTLKNVTMTGNLDMAVNSVLNAEYVEFEDDIALYDDGAGVLRVMNKAHTGYKSVYCEALQVRTSFYPAFDNSSSVGLYNKRWKDVWITRGIYFTYGAGNWDVIRLSDDGNEFWFYLNGTLRVKINTSGLVADVLDELTADAGVSIPHAGDFTWLADKMIAFTESTGLTIAAGVITIDGTNTVITPQGGAVDDLDTINGGVDGQMIIIRGDGTFTVTVKDGTGNINCAGDFAMDNAADTMTLMYDGTNTVWLELSRSNNA